MSDRHKFDIYEYTAIFMALKKHGFPETFLNRVLKKVQSNTSFKGIGRPGKKPRQSVDAQRAQFIGKLREDWPDDTDQDLISHAKMFGVFERKIIENKLPKDFMDEMPAEMLSDLQSRSGLISRLFPASSDLRASVSRGKKILSED